MLSEISQRNTNTVGCHLYGESTKKVKYKEESRMVVIRGWGWGKIERCFNGYKLSVIK